MNNRPRWLATIILLLVGIGFIPPASANESPLQQKWIIPASEEDPLTEFNDLVTVAFDKNGNVYIASRIRFDWSTTLFKYDLQGNLCWKSECLGDIVDIEVNPEGFVFVTHYTWTYPSGGYWTVKMYDSNGIELWATRYAGPGEQIAVNKEGGVYLAGSVYRSTTNEDLAIAKYDSQGRQVWTRYYDSPFQGEENFRSMCIDPSGNIYVAGNSAGEKLYSRALYDMVLVKYDSAGKELWVRRFHGDPYSDTNCVKIVTDEQGNVYCLVDDGNFSVVKYSPDGHEKLIFVNESTDRDILCHPVDMILGNQKDLYIVMHYWNSITGFDWTTILSLDFQGSLVWKCQLDDPNYANEHPEILVLDRTGDIYVASENYFQEDPFSPTIWGGDIIKVNSAGNQLWKVPVPTEEFAGLNVTTNGQIQIAGLSHLDLLALAVGYDQHDYCAEPDFGDLNRDCIVDLLDFALVAEGWGSIYSLTDVAGLAAYWLECGYAILQDCD
jgi:hypothetical protein